MKWGERAHTEDSAAVDSVKTSIRIETSKQLSTGRFNDESFGHSLVVQSRVEALSLTFLSIRPLCKLSFKYERQFYNCLP